MKKLFGSILFSFAINCYVAFATTGTINKDILYISFEWAIKSDTTVKNQLIKIDSFDLNIIPPSSGVQFYKEGIVFLSQSKNVAKMVPVHISFGTTQAYYAPIKNSELADPEVFSPSFSFHYPCDAISFSNDFNTMYFTKRGVNDNSEKIYQSTYFSGGINREGWLDSPKPMDFCTGNSAYTHPAISTDGKIIIFASDKTGSLGGMDLFITRKEGEKWSAPENLGKSINTKTNELFPFLDSENNLFFSSDGHPGLGGYDIYMCKFNGKIWEKPVNLTKQINSSNDDVAFTLNRKNGKLAFYTTIEKTKKRKIQLYKVTLNNQFALNSLLNIPDVLYTMAISDKTLSDKILAAAIKPDVKKEEIKVPEKPVIPVILPEKKPVIEPEPKVKPPEAKVVIIKPTLTTPAAQKDVVIYRVQFLSSTKPQTDNKITLNGKNYIKYEYFYLGAYRWTIGEFRTVAPAIELQSVCRKSGYPQAFVAAFKNNTRSLDLQLFK
jgi:hypothetical protein